MFQKKGEMGIGTLIIFISLLLVAAIAAGVLIQTSGSLQEKALTTGDQAKSQIATNVRVAEVSATDGSTGTLRHFTEIIKLAPGSEPIKLSQVLLTMNTYDRTVSMQYNGTSTEWGAAGYMTWDEETLAYDGTEFEVPNNDYDLDGSDDNVTGGQATANLLLGLSNGTSITLGACSGGSFSAADMTTNEVLRQVEAECNASDSVQRVTLRPQQYGEGQFTVEYLQVGPNNVTGNLQRGDVIKIYFEAPKEVTEDEEVRINFIPKIGTPTLTEFVTPEVISEERVYLYP
ncbi:MAG: archaellin/type IV pilin N-terminal domain-containing protein [Nanobdellota archaeon]